jgi:predicted phage gp36 major capsid-like protein
LEQRVSRLEELPARVDALTLQVSQLRDEMRVEFSAVRDETRAGDEETRRTLCDEIRAEGSSIREEVRLGLDKVMSQARMLYEDHRSALVLIEERRRSRRKRQPKE